MACSIKSRGNRKCFSTWTSSSSVDWIRSDLTETFDWEVGLGAAVADTEIGELILQPIL